MIIIIALPPVEIFNARQNLLRDGYSRAEVDELVRCAERLAIRYQWFYDPIQYFRDEIENARSGAI